MPEQDAGQPMFRKITHIEPLSLKEFISRIRYLLAWLYPEIHPYRWILLGTWLLTAALSVASASPIVIVKKIVENFPDGSNSFIVSIGLLAGAIIIISLLEIIGTISQGIIKFRLQHSLEMKFAKHLASLPLSFYENNTSGNVSVTPFTQIPLLTQIVELILNNFIQAGTTVIVVLITLFYFDKSIGLFALLLLPLFFLGANKLSMKIQKNVTHVFDQLSRLHSSFLESLVAVKSLRTLGISDKRINAIYNIVQDIFVTEIKVILYSGGHQLIRESVFAVGMVLLVYLLRLQYIEGGVSLAVCTALVAGFVILVREAKKIALGFIELRRVAGACTQLIAFIEHPVEVRSDSSPVISGEINDFRLEKVSFSYNDKNTILDSVDMDFQMGCITGIIGESGAGKSTLSDLLLRLREPDGGRILLNGMDFSLFSENWVRNNFGLVDQEPFLFNTTVRNNFLIACGDITDQEIRRCLELSNALEFVSQLPNGLDTHVGDGGCLLSVGEKQRIALARVLAKNPKILVLDEITSALDGENEKIVLQTLKKCSKDMVLIVITHKDSVASICNKMYSLENGHIYKLRDNGCCVN